MIVNSCSVCVYLAINSIYSKQLLLLLFLILNLVFDKTECSCKCLLRDRLVTQVCLLFWSGGKASALSLPPGDIILAQLACPLNDVIFVHSGITNKSLYKHWLIWQKGVWQNGNWRNVKLTKRRCTFQNTFERKGWLKMQHKKPDKVWRTRQNPGQVFNSRRDFLQLLCFEAKLTKLSRIYTGDTAAHLVAVAGEGYFKRLTKFLMTLHRQAIGRLCVIEPLMLKTIQKTQRRSCKSWCYDISSTCCSTNLIKNAWPNLKGQLAQLLPLLFIMYNNILETVDKMSSWRNDQSLGELGNGTECFKSETNMNVEGVTLVLPSRLFMFNKYWRILALS